MECNWYCALYEDKGWDCRSVGRGTPGPQDAWNSRNSLISSTVSSQATDRPRSGLVVQENIKFEKA